MGILQIALVMILLGRMYYLQIFEGYHYHLLAEGNRIFSRPLVPLRGQIYDRNGSILVGNETSFRLLLLVDKKKDLENTLTALEEVITLPSEGKEDILKKVAKKHNIDAIVVKEGLTWEEVSAIELHAMSLPGISLEVGARRYYPLLSEGAHVLGYVASPSEKEEEEDPTLAIPGLKMGKVGLEKYFDQRLRGTPGYRAFEVNARRKIVRDLNQNESIPGEDIHLTLDERLQKYASEVLSEYQSASAVVLDIQSGDILTLVSTPSFDPNLFPLGISHHDWGELRDNPYVPMTNKAISGLYPPGSTIKMFVALAALESGIIDKNTTVYCPGYFYVGDHPFHCWKKHGHGSINVSNAISESCDVFFYEIAKRVGIDRLSATFKSIGLGEGGLEGFPHCKKGLVPTKEWKKDKKNANWTLSDTVMTSIGQGYMQATPLELAVVIARLVGGKKVLPRLEVGKSLSFEDLEFNPEHLELIKKAMANTTNSPLGTAFFGRIQQEGKEMGGKTGTSQVRRITLEQRRAGQTKTNHLAWKYREHGLFVGYAPVHNPRYAIAVVVEHGGGPRGAIQAARDILLKAQFLEEGSK
ncbi:MAG: penicillin-binding protein 2 [Alphaproteobacteria bacterium]|nr:penicillin-binding protein 2 [Alphaproteobacteria bacterium]